jgi:CRP/FNR family transcriptional regulator, anaerobic regulatory protein
MIVGNGKPTGPYTPCEQCPLRKRPCLREFTADELAFVKTFKVDELRVDAGAGFLREGARSEYLYTVLNGWAFRYKMLDDGRRQILITRCLATWSACKALSCTRWSIRLRH